MLGFRALHISTVDGSGLVYVCILRTDLFAMHLVKVAGAEALTRWEAARARHHPYGSRARPGLADGTQEALRARLRAAQAQ